MHILNSFVRYRKNIYVYVYIHKIYKYSYIEKNNSFLQVTTESQHCLIMVS